MITLEDVKNYFFIVTPDPQKPYVHIGVQVEYKEKKDSYVKSFSIDEIKSHGVDQAKALTLSEFLEKLNEQEEEENVS